MEMSELLEKWKKRLEELEEQGKKCNDIEFLVEVALVEEFVNDLDKVSCTHNKTSVGEFEVCVNCGEIIYDRWDGT